MHTNIIIISVHTNTESYTYTHEMKVRRRNGKTPIWDAVWYSAVVMVAVALLLDFLLCSGSLPVLSEEGSAH